MSFSYFEMLSAYHFFILSLYHSVILSFSHFFILSFCYHNLKFCYSVILSFYDSVNLPFCVFFNPSFSGIMSFSSNVFPSFFFLSGHLSFRFFQSVSQPVNLLVHSSISVFVLFFSCLMM